MKASQANEERNTQSILRLCKETREIADASFTALQQQEEQLLESQRKMAQMEDELKEGDKLLRSIESVWGQFSNYFRPINSTENRDAFAQEEAKRRQQLDKEFSKLQEQYDAEKHSVRPVAKLPSTSNAPVDAKLQHMTEQDKDLDDVLDVLADIKLRAKQMNTVLDHSNKNLSNFRDKTERTNDRVLYQTKFATKLAQ